MLDDLHAVSPDDHPQVVSAIQAFASSHVSRHQRMAMRVACRFECYLEFPLAGPHYQAHVAPLGNYRDHSLVRSWIAFIQQSAVPGGDGHWSDDATPSRMLDPLKSRPALAEFLGNPLLLTLYAIEWMPSGALLLTLEQKLREGDAWPPEKATVKKHRLHLTACVYAKLDVRLADAGAC